MNSTYEHIVLGVGGIGAAAAYWLARRGGGDVLAIEQYRLGHDRGASEDHSRIIRHSYHTTEYTSLTRAAYDHMRDLEQETGLELLRITGGLHLAPSDGAGHAEIGSYARALAEQGHACEVMDGTELRTRWPQWRVGADVVGLYQAESGILDIRRVNSAHISRARAHGVRFLDRTPARKIVPFADHVEVHTESEVFEAGTLTICAGSWTETMTAGLGLDLTLTLTQEQVSYFAAADLRAFTPDRFPVWIFHGHDRTFYGFPVYGEAAVKAARDMSGRFVTQQTRRFEPDPGQTAEVAEFLARYLPGAVGPELVSKTCVYDLTADRNFILDTIPGHPRIGLFVGAGHAAKFAGPDRAHPRRPGDRRADRLPDRGVLDRPARGPRSRLPVGLPVRPGGPGAARRLIPRHVGKPRVPRHGQTPHEERTMTMAPSSVFLPTLPGRYYTDPAIFELEKREIFEKQWLYVCRAEDVPAPGRFVRATVGNENVIVVRGRDEELRAFLNVCRHRGATLCLTDAGDVGRSIRCPYHSWTYRLDGSLMSAPNWRSMEAVDKAGYGLHPVT